jgi:hypothetical protein
MHLWFAIPWRTSWIPLCYVFLYGWNTHLTFNAYVFIFCLCYFSVITWLLSFIVKIMSFMPMFRVLWSQHSMLYIVWSKLCWCMSPKKLLFCYHLPTRGQARVKLGDAWYVSNVSIIFDAPCLFMYHLLCLLLHFVAFLCIFRINLLTRCHSASSLFSAIFVFQKSYTGNILGIGWNKSQSSYFSLYEMESKAETEGAIGRPHPPWCGPPPSRTEDRCGPLVHLLTSPFRLYILLDEKTLRTQSIF